jgi:two-component system chemotaxis response regulator CheY
MTQGTSTPGKLLIVDDSAVSRMRIRAYFTSNCPKWEVLEAKTGDEAVALGASFQPDYVTMDVNMPGISGFDAAQQLMASHPGIRIVMLTANIQDSSKRMASALNVGFVAKPPTEASLSQAHQFLVK